MEINVGFRNSYLNCMCSIVSISISLGYIIIIIYLRGKDLRLTRIRYSDDG